VLGKELTQATVTDQSILGGATMVAYEARYDTLGSGALPAAPPEGMQLVDEVDVSDLESEKAHGYDARGASDQDNQVVTVGEEADWNGEVRHPGVSEGGRLHRVMDRFTVRPPAGGPARLVMRVGAEEAVELVIAVGDKEVGKVPVSPGGWVEPAVDLPAQAGEVGVTVTVVGGEGAAQFQSFHYWVYGR